jgi:hypothetical protein
MALMRPSANSGHAWTRSGRLPELLHVLMLPDLERAGAIQSYWGNRPRGPSANS